MKLWDLLNAAQYTQVFSIYTQNAYDQNIPVARGTRPEMIALDCKEGEERLFGHLMHEVDGYSINKNGVMVVFLRDKDYDRMADEQYRAEYVEKWDRKDPDSRPWLFGIETEAYTDKYIGKFPASEEFDD